MSRGIKNIDGVNYSYFRTYYDWKIVSDRRDEIERRGRKVFLEKRWPYPLYTLWVELKIRDRIALGILDLIQEFIQGHRVPYEKAIKTDDLVLRDLGVWKDKIPLLMLPVLLLIGEGLALLMVAPVQSTGAVAFSDPQSLGDPLTFFAIILVFTGLMLVLLRYRLNFILSGIIALSVFFTFSFVSLTLLSTFFGSTDAVALVSLVIAFAVTALLYYYPEWYVIDTAGFLLVAGVGALFGISIGLIPAIVLLVILAIYDAVSVYGTKHMLNLAQGVLNLKLPTIMFIIPKKRDFSYRKMGMIDAFEINRDPNRERDAYILGAGDIIIPSILVVSARVFQSSLVPVAGVVLGSLAGMLILISVLNSGKAQAGLPPINSGAIIGFLVGCAIVGSWGWLSLA